MNSRPDEALIYDVGAHKGEDTEYYLRKGFRVIAIEAMPEFCKSITSRLSEYVKSRALTVLNLAISNVPGSIKFYADESTTVWGTTNPAWVEETRAWVAVRGARLRLALPN